MLRCEILIEICKFLSQRLRELTVSTNVERTRAAAESLREGRS